MRQRSDHIVNALAFPRAWSTQGMTDPFSTEGQ